MRLITSLAINEFRECLFDLRSANQIGTQLHSWLARSERNRLISSLSQANKKTGISPVFLFTLDAIRTHDLPLRRRLLYPAELPGLTFLILARKFFLASLIFKFIYSSPIKEKSHIGSCLWIAGSMKKFLILYYKFI